MHQSLAPTSKGIKRRLPKREAANLAAGEMLTLEAVSPGVVDALNAFYRRRTPIKMTLGDEIVTVASVWPPPRTTEPLTSTIAFTMGDAKGTLHVPRPLVQRLIAQVEPSVDVAKLATEHAALLLETGLSDELAWCEGMLKCQIALTAVRESETAASAVLFAFALKGKQHDETCTLALDDAERATELGTLFDRGQTAPAGLPLDLPVPINIWRGAVVISVDELEKMAPGDVVLLDDVEHEVAAALITIGGQLVAPLEFTNTGARLTGRPRPITGSKWEWIMNSATDTTLEDSDLENLPVALIFEVGRTTLPLGEVKRLAPGAIVPLTEVTTETVDVIANGKRVGRGAIVRIGESLAVRVTRIFDNA
jgi:type III secretion protein Q